MKSIKYITTVFAAAIIVTACNQGRDKAIMGGTTDTSAVAGTNKPRDTMAADSGKKDSTYKGHADPTARDTTKTKPAQ